MLHQGGDPSLAHGGVLIAIAARCGDRADTLPVDKDRIAADEDRESSLMLGEDAERLLAGQRGRNLRPWIVAIAVALTALELCRGAALSFASRFRFYHLYTR